MTALSELNRRKERVILPTWECTRISGYVKPREGNDLRRGDRDMLLHRERVDSIFNLIHYSKVCKAQEFGHSIRVWEGWTKAAQS